METGPTNPPNPRRKRRQRLSETDSKKQDDRADMGFVETIWLLLSVGSIILLGGVPRWSLLLLALPAAIGWYALWKKDWRPDVFILTCGGLSLYSLIQAIPLPDLLLEHLSPSSAENWSHALGPKGPHDFLGAISLDPGASLAESLKWMLYGFAYALARYISSRRSPRFVFAATLAITTLLAFTALLHGLLGTSSVFGIYRASFQTGRWLVTPLLNVNNLAGVLSVGSFIGLGFLINERDLARKIALATAIALMLGIIIQTGSRATVIVIAGGVVLLTSSGLAATASTRRRRASRPLVTIVLMLCIGFGLALFTASPELVAEFTSRDFSKADLAQQVLPLISDFPWTGVGAGAFGAGFQQYSLMRRAVIWEHPENFVLAWVSEWGIPVAAFGLAVLFWYARFPRKLWGRFSIEACAHVGIIVLVFQNFADVGFAVPGVMVVLFSVMGGLNATNLRRSSSPTYIAPARFVLAGILVISWLAATSFGTTSSRDARRSIHRQLMQTNRLSVNELRQFDEKLKAAMRWFPTDSYLALAGAYPREIVSSNSSLLWVAEALRRNPHSGDAHLLLAQILRRKGVTHQALLELRLAMENDPELVARSAKYATEWTSNLEELKRAVPAPPLDRGVLIAMARVAPAQDRTLRIELLKAAFPNAPHQSSMIDGLIAEEYLDAAQYHVRPCLNENVGWCLDQAEVHIRHIHGRDESATKSKLPTAQIEARLLRQRGRNKQALHLLETHCSRTDVRCLKAWIDVAQELGQHPASAEANLLALQCRGRDSCAEAHRWLAGTYQAKNPAKALSHYIKAASEVPSLAAWQVAYDAAKRVGNKSIMQGALREMMRFSPGDTELNEQLRQIQSAAEYDGE